MNTTAINGKSYPIVISDSFADFFENFKQNLDTKKILIITDENVDNLYADEIIYIFKQYDIVVQKYVIKPGENSKNLNVVYDIYNKCLKLQFDRDSCLIALGGGVVGDITGFVASTFFRGINYVHVPTTVISQVDSSIGGKTAVNFKGYKNIIGSYYNPKLVFVNVLTLSSLDTRQYLSGMAEVIKYGIVKDTELFKMIEQNINALLIKDTEMLNKIIHRCCQIKLSIVTQDEKEQGIRTILNFGHTIGHAIESASNFELFHGESVTLGMIAASKLALKLEKLTEIEYNNVYGLFDKLSVIKNIRTIKIGKIIENLKYDKKIINNKVRFIIPNNIGNVEVIDNVDENILVEILLEMGLKLNY